MSSRQILLGQKILIDVNLRFVFNRANMFSSTLISLSLVFNHNTGPGRRWLHHHAFLKTEFVTEILLNVNNTFFVHLTVKKLNTPEYRHYLKLWNQETKPKIENTKDLPKLNQVKFHPLCRFLYSVCVQEAQSLQLSLAFLPPEPVYRALQDPLQHVQ